MSTPLSDDDAVRKFVDMQSQCVAATRLVGKSIEPGMSEADIAERYAHELSLSGLDMHWYPLLVYAGDSTALPISRRFHLPSPEVVVRTNDIVMLDCTPQDGTVWANWAETFQIGKDPFISKLIEDANHVADVIYDAARSAQTVGDVVDTSVKAIRKSGLVSLDPRDDVGHDIFQVPAGQTVDQTPLGDRLFLNEEHRARPLAGIISIEPQLGKADPSTGQMLSAKAQRVLAVGHLLSPEGTELLVG